MDNWARTVFFCILVDNSGKCLIVQQFESAHVYFLGGSTDLTEEKRIFHFIFLAFWDEHVKTKNLLVHASFLSPIL